MTPKPRLHHFDVLKGMAIFMVVMGHVLTMCVRQIDNALLFKIVGAVHMPLFFFVSGYFTYKAASDGRGWAMPNIGTRFRQLIVPFLVVSTIWIYLFPHTGLRSPFDSSWHGLYFSAGKNGYWFTLCLFQIILVYSVVSPLLRRLDSALAETAVIAAVTGVMWFVAYRTLSPQMIELIGAYPLATFFPIFMIGAMARRYPSAFERLVTDTKVYTAAMIAGGFLLYIEMYHWEFVFMTVGCSQLCVRVGLHVCLAIVAIHLIRPWTDKAFSAADSGRAIPAAALMWQYLGKESLAIYLLHYFFLFPLTPLQSVMRGMGLDIVPTLVVAATVAAMVIAVTLSVSYALRRSPLLGLLFTGKSN